MGPRQIGGIAVRAQVRCTGARTPSAGMVALVLVAGEDVVHAGPGHVREAMLREVRVAGAVEGFGEGSRQPDVLVELADGSGPASPESWPGVGSITGGVPKKSRT